MSTIRDDLKYTQDHEWISAEGNIGKIGVSDFAQESLGDVTFVELPEVGASFAKGDAFGVVESVKAASDLYLPVSGTVVEVNEALEDTPELINSSPYDDGWIVKIELEEPSQVDELLSPTAYKGLI
ncbi:MAG: glycine cleavage system protein GcvH [Opitutales bacterium]|nr:glycine cleavage system protein GcvH [Opitutales bacterium]